MSLTTGAHLRSTTSSCEVVVVHPPSTDGPVLCGGVAMSTDVMPGSGADGASVVLGKRYIHAASGLELLCVKPGPGPLVFAGEELDLKAAKPLPASD